jgi:hypothetical protein
MSRIDPIGFFAWQAATWYTSWWMMTWPLGWVAFQRADARADDEHAVLRFPAERIAASRSTPLTGDAQIIPLDIRH